MNKISLLLVPLICVSALACRPHAAGGGGHGREGGGHGLRRDCQADIEQFCAADQTGRDRRNCLQTHLIQLSEACKAAVAARGQRGGRRARDNTTQP